MNEDSDIATLCSKCTVRAAQPHDCDAMATLAVQLGYQCTGDQIEERLKYMQDPSAYAVFVAELPGGEIVGWIGVYLFRSVERDSCAEISGLVVEQDMRSRGIGKILLDAAEQWTRTTGCETISVRSNVKRDRAHRFYVNNGYEHDKTQKEFRKGL